MSKKILGVDLYQTLADVNSILIREIKNEFNKELKMEEITSWKTIPDLVGEDTMWRLYREAWVKHYRDINLVDPRAPSALYKALGKGYDVRIITSTQMEALTEIAKWLLYMKIPFKTFIAISDGQSKWDYDFDAIIDDNPRMADSADKYPDRLFFLLNSPWNKDVKDTNNVIRVLSFNEMLQYL